MTHIQQRVSIPSIFRFLFLLVLSGTVVRLEEARAAEFLRERVVYRNDGNSGDARSYIDFEVNPTKEEKELGEIFRDDVNGDTEDEAVIDAKLKKEEEKEKFPFNFYKKTGKNSKNSKREAFKPDFLYGLDDNLEPVLTEEDLERHIKENLLGKKEAEALRRAGPLPEGFFDERRFGSDGRGGVVLTEKELEIVIKTNKIDDREAEVFRVLRPYSYYYTTSYNYYGSKGGKGSKSDRYYSSNGRGYYGYGKGKGYDGYSSYSFSPYQQGYSYGHRQRSFYNYYGNNGGNYYPYY